MKTKTKRTLSLLLSMVMLLTSLCGFSVTAFAAKVHTAIAGGYRYSYTVKDSKATIVYLDSYKEDRSKSTLKIPSKLGGYPVTKIASGDLTEGPPPINHEELGPNITSIVLPDTLVTVGEYAIYSPFLQSITLGAKVKNFTAESVFCFYDYQFSTIKVNKNNKYFKASDGVLFNKSKTKLVMYPKGHAGSKYTVPKSVKTIGKYAFYKAVKLKTVTLQNGVKTIGASAFVECEKLEKVTLPSSVATVNNYAFATDALTTVTVKNKKCKINKYAFPKSKKLTIKGYKNSTAQKYAKSRGVKFAVIK